MSKPEKEKYGTTEGGDKNRSVSLSQVADEPEPQAPREHESIRLLY